MERHVRRAQERIAVLAVVWKQRNSQRSRDLAQRRSRVAEDEARDRQPDDSPAPRLARITARMAAAEANTALFHEFSTSLIRNSLMEDGKNP